MDKQNKENFLPLQGIKVLDFTQAMMGPLASMMLGDMGADVLLLFSTPSEDENRLVNIKMYWTRDTRLFAELEQHVGKGQVSVFSP